MARWVKILLFGLVFCAVVFLFMDKVWNPMQDNQLKKDWDEQVQQELRSVKKPASDSKLPKKEIEEKKESKKKESKKK